MTKIKPIHFLYVHPALVLFKKILVNTPVMTIFRFPKTRNVVGSNNTKAGNDTAWCNKKIKLGIGYNMTVFTCVVITTLVLALSDDDDDDDDAIKRIPLFNKTKLIDNFNASASNGTVATL